MKKNDKLTTPTIPDPMDGMNITRSPFEQVNGLPDRIPALRDRLRELEAATHLAPVNGVAGPAESVESPGLRPALTFSGRRDESDVPEDMEE